MNFPINFVYIILHIFLSQGISGPAGKNGRQGRDGTAVSTYRKIFPES
jgi:hypothetical protein